MITAIIFDLDNCLASAREVGEELYGPAFDAIRRANKGTVAEEKLREAFEACWRHPLDWVAARYGFTDEMLRAGWKEFGRLEVSRPMTGYGDLQQVGELRVDCFLVTSGFRRLQESKIAALGLARWFAAMHVDAIDEDERLGKQGWFERLTESHGLAPEDVLVVGDNPESEIEAGNRLGMVTVQILRPGVPRGSNARGYVENLAELRGLLRQHHDAAPPMNGRPPGG